MTSAFFAHLWQSTWCVAAAWLLTVLLRGNGANVRYWIWFIASLKFLVPFALLAQIGSQFERHSAIVQSPPPLVNTVAEYGLVLVVVPATLSNAAAPAPDSHRDVILLAVWLTGFAAIAFTWLRRYARISVLRRAAKPIKISGCPIPVFCHENAVVPGVFGIRKPVLLFPSLLMDRLTEAQLEAVVAHELSHVRRNDNLTSALHMFVQSIFWFHPVVWWVGSCLLEERERACDEEVVKHGTRPRDYAEGILNVCKVCIASPVPCVGGVGGSNLKQRIDRIMSGINVKRVGTPAKAAMGLALSLILIAPVVIGMLYGPRIMAQTPDSAAPKFEVVSVKRCQAQPGQTRGGGQSSPGRLRTGCDLLADSNNLGFIQGAYNPSRNSPLPIVGGPKWIRSDMYEIEATAPGQPSPATMRGPMLRALLEDRFKLRIHREIKTGPVYALKLTGGSLKLKPFVEGTCIQMPPERPVPRAPSGQRYCDAVIFFQGPSVRAEGSTLAEFSKLLGVFLDRPVIDQTGLTRRFDFHLEFARDNTTPGLLTPESLRDVPAPAPSDPERPSIFIAVQEQLGLKLVSTTGPVERLIIDRIERPSEN